jgi:hypothetical protein
MVELGMQEGVLLPGGAISGFVYFKLLAPAGSGFEAAGIEVDVTSADNDRVALGVGLMIKIPLL